VAVIALIMAAIVVMVGKAVGNEASSSSTD
jgi:hypothetical protein